ncbi:MAG: hypothetical protein M1833_006709 [Piccolia ochrophora]|nr:MAG: hypothetical protein M1833_006709 [Piccolia ochrophora]
MAPMSGAHHHRSTTKAPQKPYKSKYASKNSLREQSKGKIETADKSKRRTPHQQVMSKLDRRNQARQKQQIKHQQHTKATSVFSGRAGAPRIVAVLSLCGENDGQLAVQQLNESLDLEADEVSTGITRVHVDRFKQKLDYVVVEGDLTTVLDACRVADYVLIVLSAQEEVDEHGEHLLRSVEGQGIPNVLITAQGVDKVEPPKKRPQVVSSLKSYINHFFPGSEKVHNLSSQQDCSNIIRSLCSTTPKGIRWREERSWMLVEAVQWPNSDVSPVANGPEEHTEEVVVTGVIRGKPLKADRLIHVGDWGDFQISKIAAAPPPTRKETKAKDMVVDEEGGENTLEEPTQDQDDLAEYAPEEIMMADVDNTPTEASLTSRKGVLLDDHHYFSDDETHIPPPPKRLPKGTSSYQSAWYLDDVSDSGSEMEEGLDQDGDLPMKPPALPQDGLEGRDQAMAREPTEFTPSEAPTSEMFLDPAPDEEAEQLAEFRARKKNEAEEDLEFPDEIELRPNVLARERLAKYRGLKSLRTSHWETEEDRPHEPENWNRLLQVPDYKGSRSKVTREALVGGVQPGKRVHIHLRNVPSSLQKTHDPSKPLNLFSLLRHEHKRTVVNISITLDSAHPGPIKSKSELIVQCGPRRFVAHPLFSQPGHTPNDVHKFLRYLHPGRTAVASFIAPLTWGPVPTLFFTRSQTATTSTPSPLTLIAHGTHLAPSPSRIIAKRIILTGHPYKIHRRVVTIRYMFFNKADVQWFAALPLWTRRGRSGFIRESLGTHGYFKAGFDGRVGAQDAVGVSLYKRVWPMVGRGYGPEDRVGERTGGGDEEEMGGIVV